MYLVEGLAASPNEVEEGKPSSLVVARPLTDPTARTQFNPESPLSHSLPTLPLTQSASTSVLSTPS